MRVLITAAFLSFGIIAADVLLSESAAAQSEFPTQSTTETDVRRGERPAESPITVDQTTAAGDSGPRLQGAEELSRSGAVKAARLLPEKHSAEHNSPEQLCNAVVVAAKAYELPLAFFANLLWQESRFNPHAVSRAGAEGIAQFMPATAARSGLADSFDPWQAIPASAQLLRQLKRQFGNWGLAAAAYNSGPKRVTDWLARRSELPRETRGYVSTITGFSAEQWRGSQAQTDTLLFAQRLPCRQMPVFAEQESAARATNVAQTDFREVAPSGLPAGSERRRFAVLHSERRPLPSTLTLLAKIHSVHHTSLKERGPHTAKFGHVKLAAREPVKSSAHRGRSGTNGRGSSEKMKVT
jgi:hypothetical protein